MADELKAKGNAAFSSGKFEEAIEHYTQAIGADGSNHVLYSNRSACQASLKHWDEALSDAEKCVELKPDFAKGYSRLGSALYGQSKYAEAKDAYQKGLDIDSSNTQLQQGLQAAEDRLAGGGGGDGSGGGGMFGPDFMTKLAMNAETRKYLEQPDFKRMINMCNSNPSMMTNFMQDKRFAKALEVGLGISLGFAGEGGANMATGGEEGDEVDGPGLKGARTERAAPRPAPAPAPPKEPEPELTEEEKAEKEQKEQAVEEKNKGNAAYKKRDFDEAIAHYDKAIELYDKDISFITNRAAVHYEKKDYDEAIKDCELAVEKGRQVRPIDFKLIAKAMTRHGNCLLRKDDFDGAIEMFNCSLTEHRTPEALKARDAAEKTLKARTEEAYIDLDKAEEARQLGNEAFKGAEYPKAVEHYSEALKRGPPGKWDEAYKLFSNRAACYTKLGALPQAEKDADKCIELQPTFAKGYIRKAHVQFFTKDFEKALETYETGLKQDPDNHELLEGKMKCQQSMARFLNGMATDEEVKERQARAMSDPQIQTIMTDPVMQQVLKECQESPGSVSKHMQNPGIGAKLKKLMTAGIIRVA